MSKLSLQRFVCVILFLPLLRWNVSVLADCIWYGECAIDYDTDLPLNCPYDGPPIPLNSELARRHLYELCPSFKQKENPLTCCSPAELATFHKSVGLAFVKNIIERCPACWYNFRLFHCNTLCSPIQSDFMTVQELLEDAESLNVSVKAVQMYVQKSTADKLFKSCQRVNSRLGIPALNILCETDVKDCSGTIWVQNMGKSPFSPIFFNTTVTEVDKVHENGHVFTPLNLDIKACEKPVEIDGPICSCADCATACKNETPPFPLPKPPISIILMIGGRDGMTIVAIITYIVLMLLFLLGLLIVWCNKYRAKKHPATSVLDMASVRTPSTYISNL